MNMKMNMNSLSISSNMLICTNVFIILLGIHGNADSKGVIHIHIHATVNKNISC